MNLSNYFDLEKKKDTCLILHDVLTPLTTMLVFEIKMAAQIPRLKVSDVLQGFKISNKILGKCLIKVRTHFQFQFTFLEYSIFLGIIRFSSNCAIRCDLRSIVRNRTIALYQMACQFSILHNELLRNTTHEGLSS